MYLVASVCLCVSCLSCSCSDFWKLWPRNFRKTLHPQTLYCTACNSSHYNPIPRFWLGAGALLPDPNSKTPLLWNPEFASDSTHRQMTVINLYQSKAGDRRTIKVLLVNFIADKIGRFYRSCVIQKSANFLCPIKSADKIDRLYRSSVIGLNLQSIDIAH